MPTKTDRDIINIDISAEDVKETRFGIYAYRRISNKEILYIGKDSDIMNKSRYYHHSAPSKRKEQRINSYLQSSAAKGIEYIVLALTPDKETMENLESIYIIIHKAMNECKFNEAIDINKEARNNIIEYLDDPNLKIN